MAGANAHLMLIYNFHQIGENWLRIEWKLKFFFAWDAKPIPRLGDFTGLGDKMLHLLVNKRLLFLFSPVSRCPTA